MHKNQKVFGIVEGLLILVIVGLVGFVGWYVWSKSNSSTNSWPNNTQHPTKPGSKTQDTTFSVIINPMVGGGFAGAVSAYEITSTGEVYYLHSPNYSTPIVKDLLKKVDEKEVQDLRKSFIDSGFLNIESVNGPKYGGSAWEVTINGNQKTFYDPSSLIFSGPKAKLQLILGDALKL